MRLTVYRIIKTVFCVICLVTLIITVVGARGFLHSDRMSVWEQLRTWKLGFHGNSKQTGKCFPL